MPVPTIAAVLNHVDRTARITHVYARHDYGPEKRAALDTWARTLTAILQSKPKSTNVVPIRKRA